MMNSIAWVILLALIVDFVIGVLLTILNIRSLQAIPPRGLEDVYDPGAYRTSQTYTRTHANFGLFSSSINLGLLLIFWFSGGFNFLDQIVRSTGWGDVWGGVLFIGLLGLIVMLVNIPQGLYSTFVIEGRFGFNKSTLSTYLIDTAKSVSISLIIGAPLLLAILYFFDNAGSLSWLYAWGFVTVVSFCISVIAPIWIMPIFNKFIPLQSGELRQAIIEYADSVKFTYGNIYVIDGSKRSAHSNAFFTGFGKTKRIALFDTLIEQLTPKEIVAVIAHEVGHNKKHHILAGMVLGILHTGILFFLFSLVMESQLLFEAFFMEDVSVYASIVFFGLLFTPLELIMSPLLQSLSRRNEFQADRWAVDTTFEKQHLISGLKKLAANNLSNLSPHPLFVTLNYSHPPLLKRINAINISTGP